MVFTRHIQSKIGSVSLIVRYSLGNNLLFFEKNINNNSYFPNNYWQIGLLLFDNHNKHWQIMNPIILPVHLPVFFIHVAIPQQYPGEIPRMQPAACPPWPQAGCHKLSSLPLQENHRKTMGKAQEKHRNMIFFMEFYGIYPPVSATWLENHRTQWSFSFAGNITDMSMVHGFQRAMFDDTGGYKIIYNIPQLHIQDKEQITWNIKIYHIQPLLYCKSTTSMVSSSLVCQMKCAVMRSAQGHACYLPKLKTLGIRKTVVHTYYCFDSFSVFH